MVNWTICTKQTNKENLFNAISGHHLKSWGRERRLPKNKKQDGEFHQKTQIFKSPVEIIELKNITKVKNSMDELPAV